MLFVTWNVNSLRARLPRVIELLEQHRPNVVALQETKCTAANFPADALEAAGYRAVHSSGGQWSGVALLARRALALGNPVQQLPGDVAPWEARWCEATVSGMRFISAYVPNGRALAHAEFGRKLASLAAAGKRLADLRASRPAGDGASGAPVVLAGDLNVAPRDQDVYDPGAFIGATHVSRAERDALAHLCDTGKLVDAYRSLHPSEPQFTWWDYRGGSFHKNLGMRIDLILASAELAERLQACGIDRDFRKGVRPSDHAPLLARFADV